MENESLIAFGKSIIDLANTFDKAIRETNLENTQFFLNWQDDLNEISVR